MRKSRFDINKKAILSFFTRNNQVIYSFIEIKKIFYKKRDKWNLGSLRFSKFLDLMLAKSKLRDFEISFPKKDYTFYIWGDIPLYCLIQHINKNGYFAYYSAIAIHELTEQIPKVFYFKIENVTIEKAKKQVIITQEAIDNAFKKPARTSNNIGYYRGDKDYPLVHIIAGKKTDDLGIELKEMAKNSVIRVTNLERTLIDMVIRPEYVGGIDEVLKAFVRARNKLSVNKLKAMLLKLEYIYPYHQVIGFYLERAEVYEPYQVKIFEDINKTFDFYLCHSITDMEYSQKWKLFYPKNF